VQLAGQTPRYHLHFTLTHGSWINQVERWFAQVSQKQIKRGNHHLVKQLKRRHRSLHNASPKPFPRVKSADQIPASVARFARSAVLQAMNDSGDKKRLREKPGNGSFDSVAGREKH
jgi:hypothetical protein